MGTPVSNTRAPLRIPLVTRLPVKVSRAALAAGALTLTMAVSGAAMFEPSPYEYMVLVLLGFACLFGLSLHRGLAPLLALLALYNLGGILVFASSPINTQSLQFAASSLFMALSAILIAALLAENPQRFSSLERGYVFAAVLSSTLGAVGYFDLFSGAFDSLTLYGRAKALFKDPNVYGPFLIVPCLLLTYDVLTKPLGRSMFRALLLLLLVLGVFLSFSRAAWGAFLGASALLFLIVYINEMRQIYRIRLLCMLALGFILLVLALVSALSLEPVSAMFFERARLVQDYDSARLGRFARHLLGFFHITEYPLGIGPGTFGKLFTEDEHNVYLKGFTTYGWLGGLSYTSLVLLTLLKATPLIFKPRPWQKYTVCFFCAFVLHSLLGFIIDTDHWRHFFLILAGLWAVIAMEQKTVISEELSTRTIAPPVLRS
ncbi:O-antigen ligase family protein [Flexibacterium corallicola]|uniref:O-antigen ligase family protein n=1 Tax=Flexibacterium corallicola TaxID=3037259 RepID=UPI00286F9C5F|nr:O-antigen ligase family protein [Pseudovibrio sp. M1P-2-3]